MRELLLNKNTENQILGNIPSNWGYLPLKYIARVTLGKMLSPEAKDGLIPKPYLRSQNIQTNIVSTDDVKTMWFLPQELPKYRLRFGDILVNEGGDIGRTCIWNDELEECYIQNSVNRIQIIGGSNRYYLYHFFLYHQRGYFDSIVNRVSIPHLTKEKLESVKFVVPPADIQFQIANYLDHKTAQIDKLISDKEKLIELLNEERTAIINQAVTKGIDPDAPMKDSGVDWLGEVPKHWEIKKIKHVAEVNSIRNNYDFERASVQEVVFLPMEKVSENGEVAQDTKRKINEVSSGFTYFERNDIIVAKITPCFENGKGALLSNLETNFGYGSTEFHTLRTKSGLDNKFLYYVTKSELFMTIGEAFMTGAAGQKRVPTGFIKEFKIGLPSLEEQLKIVEHIENVQSKINSTSNQIIKETNLLKEYKIALISEVVTGKVDVRNEVISETENLTLAS